MILSVWPIIFCLLKIQIGWMNEWHLTKPFAHHFHNIIIVLHRYLQHENCIKSNNDLVSDATNSLSHTAVCFQYIQIFNPFLFGAIARARTRDSPIDWIKMRFCRCTAEMFDIISNIQKIQNWNINQFFIDNDYNFHSVVVCICLDENKEGHRKKERGESFCHQAFSANRMPSFFPNSFDTNGNDIAITLTGFCNSSDGGKNNNTITTTDKLKFVGFCQFFDL